MNKVLSLYMLILGMILTFCVTYQYQNEVFALANDGSQIKEGFSLYHSPKLGFDIEYSSDWTVKEKENRFDDASDVTFTSPATAINGYVGVDYEDTTVEAYDNLVESGFDEGEIMERG